MTARISWSEATLRELLDSAPDAMLIVAPGGDIVYANQQTERIFGYRAEDLVGKKIEFLLPARYREKHVGQRDGFFASPRVRPMGAGMELWGLRADGSEVAVEASLAPLRSSEGAFVTASIRDISERRRAQQELQRASELADSANRAKSEFLANMSHEIRTPLAAILGYSEMVALYCRDDGERRSYLERIRRSANNLTTLINDILDLSKVEAGALDVERVPVPLVTEIEGILTQCHGQASEKGLSLEVAYARPLPAYITSDPTRLRQILSNLVGNAIKFTEKGVVRVAVRIATADGSRRLVIEVSDTGCGLAPDQQARLFQPFAQADSSTTRRFGGTGLGLALSRKLARALGGDLVLSESIVNRGSTFALMLELGPDEVAPSPSETDKTELPSLEGIRVLLAEDNPDNEEIIRRFLSHHGANIEVAHDGEEALRRIEGGNFNVVLMDIQMPKLDGYEATKRLRRQGNLIPVIALTAHAMNEERERCRAAGCNDFLTKPLDIPALVRAVHRHAMKPHQ